MFRGRKTLGARLLAKLSASNVHNIHPQAAPGEIEGLRAKLDHERAKVRKLVEMQDRLSTERAAWMAERDRLEHRLALLENQQRQPLSTTKSYSEPDFSQTVSLAQRSPLRILMVGPNRKTIVEFIQDAMIFGDPSQGPFDLLVIPRPEKQDLNQVADYIPQTVWSAVRAGKTKLILDGSSEGNLNRVLLERFKALAERTATPLEHILYLTQNRMAIDHHGIRGRGFHIPLPMLNYDYHLHRTLRPMLEHGQDAFRVRLAHYSKAPRRGRRPFLSLNLSLKSHKALLLARLLHDGLWDSGFISFGGFGTIGDGETLPNEFLQGFQWGDFEAAAQEVAPEISALNRKGAILFGAPEGADASGFVKDALHAGHLQEYRRSWFSVVTETEMSRDALRITEKVLKPVLNFHPFIMLGNPGALQLVRNYGIQTFPELFDESYDDEEDPVRRFDIVYGQIDRLARMDEAELDRLEASVAEKIVFNARLGLTELPRIFQYSLLPAAIDRMLRPSGPAAAAPIRSR